MKVISSIKMGEDRVQKLLAAQPQAKIDQVKDFSEKDEEAEILLTYGWDLKKETLDLYPNLKWVQTLSAGVDTLPLAGLDEKKILLTNVKGAHKIQMAEHVVWSILMLLRQGVTFVKQQEKRIFSAKPPVDEMYGKTVCIIGAGMIGKEIAQRCSAFGMKVLGVSRKGIHDEAFAKVVTTDEMSEVVGVSDIVVVVLPLTPKTRNFINEDFIKLMKDGALLVNAARGPVADEAALLKALQDRKITAAALDVFVREPLPEDSPFWSLENIFITPHIGGRTIQASERMWEVFTRNLSTYPDLQEMINRIDLSVGY
ncbi:MAG: putative 2-hydroxyacid dehydrogenase [Candidatus Dichloromethanomonas elyunquensis]|nr:MAG: putative 2-hydroxyacid dehydrogenase [Candidatus Dichloromethanomonas elyunquensis]